MRIPLNQKRIIGGHILFASVVEPPNEFSVSIWLNNINRNIKPYKNMSTKTPECWASDPQARGLRIEVSPDRSLLLPHNHFIFAELDSSGDEQNLKLVFTTHEISVRGHHLRRIETVLQRMELSLLAKLPSNQRKAYHGRPADGVGNWKQRPPQNPRPSETVRRVSGSRCHHLQRESGI
jgi:hypothetical protein